MLCGFAGGEAGAIVAGLLASSPASCDWRDRGAHRLLRRRSSRRGAPTGRRRLSGPPSRHELDELFSATCAAALASEVLVVCNPFPADALPAEIYATLVADVRANGTPVLVDLSDAAPRQRAEGRPDLVKLNDWELAEYVRGPVDGPRELRAAAERLRAAGARTVLVTRGGEPAIAAARRGAFELVPPALRPRARARAAATR